MLDAINEMSDGKFVYVLDMQEDIVYWSGAAKEYFGFPSNEMSGFHEYWQSKIRPDDVGKYKREISKILNHQRDRFYHMYHVTDAAGNYILVRGKGKVISDAEGNPTLFAGTVTVCADAVSYDVVTGLQGQSGFLRKIEKYELEKRQYATFAIEVPNFFEINSLYGYNFGSQVIYDMASILHRMVENIGHVYRLEGARFTFIVHNRSIEDIKLMYNKIREEFEHLTVGNETLNLDVIGSALYIPNYRAEAQMMLTCLIVALERAKAEGIFDLVVYDGDMHSDVRETLELIDSIKTSIMNGCEGFFLCYQPFVSTMTGRVIGAEALIRWRNDVYGTVSPYRFIPYLENHPCFYELGLWIIRQALSDSKKVMDFNPDFFINVNMSYSQLEKSGFKEDVIEILKEMDYPNAHLQLELTERCRNLNVNFLKEQLEFFKENGVKIALDDFGTGTSTIDLLCDLPIDCVKIDQTFILNILKNNNNQVVVDATLQCTNKLGLHVCLEGVENEEIKNFVSKYSAKYHQGYYYSKPVEFDEFIKLIDQKWSTNKINIISQGEKAGMDVNYIISMMPGAFFIYCDDEMQKITCANRMLLDIFECDTEEEFYELTGNTFKGIVHPDDYERVQSEIENQLKDNASKMDFVKYRIITKSGDLKVVRDYGHLVTQENDVDLFYVFIAIDR